MKKIFISLFSIIILTLLVVAGNFLFAYFREESIITASGQQNLDFRVFYFEDTIFGESIIPQNQDFLMSYTNYIEINNSFSANFSHETDIYYNYHAEKTLVIRHIGDNYNIVFRHTFPIIEEVRGVLREVEQLYFSIDTFRIYPIEFIKMYLDFVQDQRQQMEHQAQQIGVAAIIAQGLRGFSAELFIDFTYSIRDNTQQNESNLNQTITHGYRIPLTTEVYSFTLTGTPNFEWQQSISTENIEIRLTAIILFVITFSLSLFGLIHNIKSLIVLDLNKQRQKANDILKKYSNEIVIYDKPIDINHYKPMIVQEFRELLKLAINLNKHIMCYRNDLHTQFAVIIDDFACLYTINYGNDDSELNISVNIPVENSTKNKLQQPIE